ncbi:MAG: hypothetical protein LBF22_12930 [Deltaproteobacteria bacterium]|nr:hypothetical protein [Deltaproteobacteria bacterium]
MPCALRAHITEYIGFAVGRRPLLSQRMLMPAFVPFGQASEGIPNSKSGTHT